MRNAVLVDIDHTLRAAWPRDHMIGMASWDDYHAAGPNDEPIHDMINVINSMHRHGHDIIAITIIPEKWRRITTEWLAKHEARIDEVLMRPDDDFKPAPELKLMLAKQRFPDLAESVVCLFEDRPDVCAVFIEAGITVLQVFGKRT